MECPMGTLLALLLFVWSGLFMLLGWFHPNSTQESGSSTSRPKRRLLIGLWAAISITSVLLVFFPYVLQRPDKVAPQRETGQPVPATASPNNDKLDFLKYEVRGSAAVQAPSTAKQFVPFTAELKLMPGKLDRLLREFQNNPNTTVVGKENIWVAPTMEANLSGSGFDISLIGQQEVNPTENEPTVWKWNVTPKSSGTRKLIFTLTGKVYNHSSDAVEKYNLYVDELEVTVQVNPTEFFEQNWEAIFKYAGVVVSTIATATWAVWKWRHPTPTPHPPSSPHPENKVISIRRRRRQRD